MGTPFILKAAKENEDWMPTPPVSSSSTSIALKPTSKEPSSATDYGIFGAFDTKSLGTGYYKVNESGTALVKTTASSRCYPYRVYLKLPELTASSAPYRLVFEESTDGISHVSTDAALSTPTYDLYGRRVKEGATGIVVRDGQKVMMR